MQQGQKRGSLSQRQAQGAVSYLVGAQALGVQVDPSFAQQLLGRHSGANALQGCSSASLAALAAALQAMGSAPSGDLLEAYAQVSGVLRTLDSSNISQPYVLLTMGLSLRGPAGDVCTGQWRAVHT